jgi:cell wall-associated NlpC family hydrolase
MLYCTSGALRWDGIVHRRIARAGQYPAYADCSSFVTWCLWNGLYLGINVGDVVNGAHWRAGFTGTMLQHGAAVSAGSALPGDAVIYGRRGTSGAHTAIVVRSRSTPMVGPNDSEGGPFDLRYNNRSDVLPIRRYI